jgi:hypothetical protein
VRGLLEQERHGGQCHHEQRDDRPQPLLAQLAHQPAEQPRHHGKIRKVEVHRTGEVTTAGGAGLDGLWLETVWVVEDAGPAGVAPLSRPSSAGSRYVVAEMVAVICGNPFELGASEIAFRVISRPLTERR